MLRLGVDLPDGSTVKLYGCESAEIAEATVQNRVAVFEKGTVLEGFSYLPEFIKRDDDGLAQRIHGCAMSAIAAGGRVYMVRKAGNITYEFAKMWRMIAESLQSATLARQTASDALEQVVSLSKGYRTE